jgi:hypothetical protein
VNKERVSLWGLWIIVVVAVGYAGSSRFARSIDDWQHRLSLSREGDIVRLSTASDGPFLVFGIAAYGESSRDKCWSAIEPPLVIMDSNGATVDLKSLHWRDDHNEPASQPTGQRLYPLFVRPERFDPYSHRD